jgi:hypothetical protein
VPNDGGAAGGLPPDAELSASTSYHVHLSKNALIILVAGFVAFALFVLAVLHYSKPDTPAPTAGEPEEVGILPVENADV